MSEDEVGVTVTDLEHAERFFRAVASGSTGSDTEQAFRVLVAEYDRRAARIAELESSTADNKEP